MLISVLYVDDEPDLLEICKLFLEQGGEIRVDTITQAPAALDLLKTHTYDAIISDYQMPDMDGIAFLEAVRQEHTIPFILFTGRGREEIVIRALNNGADFYLQKGGDPRAQFAELAHKVRVAVERRKDAEDLRINMERLHMAQEIGQAGSWEYDLKNRTIWASGQAFCLFGINRPSGIVPYEVIESCYVNRKEVQESLVRLVHSKEKYDIVYAINPADGSEQKIIHSVAKRVLDADGNLLKLFGVIQDITGKKRAEDELREQEAMLNAAQRVARIGSWEIDLISGRIIWSDELYRILGRGPRSFSPTLDTLFQFIHPDDRGAVMDSVKKAMADHQAFEIVFRVLLPDGTTRSIRDLGETQYDGAGRPVRIVGAALDITDQKKIESRLLENEEKYRLLLDESSDPIFSIRQDGTYQYVNRAFAEGVGRTVDSVVGRKIFDVFPEDEAAKRFSALSEVFATGRQKAFEVRVPRPDSDRYYLTTITPIKDTAGEILSVICSSKEITGRKQAEEELRKSEEKFRSFVENANDLVYTMNADGVFTYISPNIRELLGYAPDEIAGRIFGRFIHPDDLPACRGFLADLITTGEKKAGLEYRLLHRDGTWRWYVSNNSPIKNLRGEPVSVLGIARDITDRKRIDQDLRAEKERYQNLVDSLRDVIWQATPALQFTYVSRYGETVLGYSLDEILGKSLFDFLTPSSAEYIRDQLALRLAADPALRANHQAYVVEMQRKDGRRIWVEVSTGPVYDPDTGKITGFQGISRDISERKKAEIALADRLVFQQTLVESIPYPVFIKDATGRFAGCNRAYEQAFGITRDYLAGKTVLDLEYLVPGERDRFHAEDLAVIHEAGRRRYELPIKYPDGQTRQILYSVDGFRLADGRPGGLIGMLVDISDRKQMEDALKQANRQLSLLTSITRHDINNKITAILGYLDLAAMDGTGHAPGEYVEKLKALTTAIRTQIEFTKVYQDLGSQLPRWQDLDALLPRSQLAGEITLAADVQGLLVFADPMLPKVFFNLLDNSLRHGERVTRITVRAIPSPEGMAVVWEDNGTGIAPDQKEKIFERGFGRNTGLGLFLVREILALTRITIRETGTYGTGARFEILVPNGMYRENPPVTGPGA